MRITSGQSEVIGGYRVGHRCSYRTQTRLCLRTSLLGIVYMAVTSPILLEIKMHIWQ